MISALIFYRLSDLTFIFIYYFFLSLPSERIERRRCFHRIVCVCPRSHSRNFKPILMKFGTDVWNLKRKIPFVGGENPIRVFPIFTQFYPKLDLHNAFSMGVLKHFSGVVCGPIIAVQSSNDVPWWPPTPECQKRVNGVWPRSRDPVNFWALNGNVSKMAEDTSNLTCMLRRQSIL